MNLKRINRYSFLSQQTFAYTLTLQHLLGTNSLQPLASASIIRPTSTPLLNEKCQETMPNKATFFSMTLPGVFKVDGTEELYFSDTIPKGNVAA